MLPNRVSFSLFTVVVLIGEMFSIASTCGIDLPGYFLYRFPGRRIRVSLRFLAVERSILETGIFPIISSINRKWSPKAGLARPARLPIIHALFNCLLLGKVWAALC